MSCTDAETKKYCCFSRNSFPCKRLGQLVIRQHLWTLYKSISRCMSLIDKYWQCFDGFMIHRIGVRHVRTSEAKRTGTFFSFFHFFVGGGTQVYEKNWVIHTWGCMRSLGDTYIPGTLKIQYKPQNLNLFKYTQILSSIVIWRTQQTWNIISISIWPDKNDHQGKGHC